MKKNILLSRKYFLLLSILIVGCAAFLRLYQLDTVPPALYWEEAALGYDAYSIALTGKDHHGNAFPIVAFPSFGDYKPSGYFYLIVPFIWLLGLSEWAVRLPSALFGIATVIGVGVLARMLTEKIWVGRTLPQLRLAQLVGMGVAAFSPWLLQFSRGGWEVNVASSLLLWSVIVGLSAVVEQPTQRRFIKILCCFVLAGLSMYVYHATRVIAPALLVALTYWWVSPLQAFRKNGLKKLITRVKSLLLPGVILLLIVLPILISSRDVTTQQRFAETSITGDGQYVIESNRLRETTGNTLLSRLFTHRYLILGHQVAVAFASHFSLDFLFLSGDLNPRHSTGYTGILSLPDALWLVIGIVTVASLAWREKEARPYVFLLSWWLVVGLLPASITKAYPHALRTLPAAPVLLVLVSLGLWQSLLWLRKTFPPKSAGVIAAGALSLIALYWLGTWRYYMKIYPVMSQADWQYGYKQMVAKVDQLKTTYPDQEVFITREYGRPAMYYWFYTKTSPADVQAAEATALKDQAEFLQFENISFVNSVNEAKPGIVASSLKGYEQLSRDSSSVEKLDEVKDLKGNVVWVISRVNQATPVQ